MKYFAFFSLLLILSTLAKAQNCFSERSSNLKSKDIPSTCLRAKLNSALEARNDLNFYRDFSNAFFDNLDFTGVIRISLERITKDREYISPDNKLVQKNLTLYLEQYLKEINHGPTTGSPNTIFQLTQNSMKYFLELNSILKDKRLNMEERHSIQTIMYNLKFIYESGASQLTANHLNKMKKEIEKLKDISKESVTNYKLNNYLGKVEKFAKEIESIKNKLEILERNPEVNQAEITRLKNELLATQQGDRSRDLISEIKNYTIFSQGVVSVYSLFYPQEAHQLSTAIASISNISTGIVTLSSLGETATASSYLGAYGAIASGSIQLFNSFQNNNQNSPIFKEIFKELKRISKQISDMQINIDKRFDRIDYSLISLERNILEKLKDISLQIQNLKLAIEASNNTLNEISFSLEKFGHIYINERIDSSIEKNYLSIINKCIGKNTANIKNSKKKTYSCLDDLEYWGQNFVTSPLLTKKSFENQYQDRRLFDFQINDLTSYYKKWSSSPAIKTNLANPLLLKDLSDSLNILRARKKRIKHTVFEWVKSQEQAIAEFQSIQMKDDSFTQHLKDNYKRELNSAHQKIKRKSQEVSNTKQLEFHKNRLAQFQSLLRNSLIARGEKLEEESSLPFNDIIAKDYNKTLDVLRNMDKKFSGNEYKGSLVDLIDKDLIKVFAKNCSPSETGIDTLIPIDIDYLKSKIGPEILHRMLLNPNKEDICYHLETKKNSPLFSITSTSDGSRYLAKNRPWGEMIATGNHLQWENKFAGFIYQAHSANDLTIYHSGLFLESISINVFFEGNIILSDTQKFKQPMKMAWWNNTTDPLSILTFIEGQSYYSKYPPFLNNSNGIITTYSISENASSDIGQNFFSHFKNTSLESKRFLEYLKKQDQARLFSLEKAAYQSQEVKELCHFIQSQDFSAITEAGRFLTLNLFFKSPKNFVSNVNYINSLSDIWGLKSGFFLKRFYIETTLASNNIYDIDFVYTNQKSVLDNLENVSY